LPARERPDAVGVEQEVAVPRHPAALVEAVPLAVPDGEREEADALVELDVDSAGDALAERHLDRRQLVLRQRGHSAGSLGPRTDVLLVDEPDGRQAVVEDCAELVDDAAVEEDPVRQRVDEEQPGPADRVAGRRIGRRPAVDHWSRLGHLPRRPIVENPRATTLGTLILGTALLVAAAGLITACLRLRSVADFALAFFVVSFSLVVVIELLLSPGRDLTRSWLLAVLGGAVVVSAGAWLAAGRPALPPAGPALAAAREALRDPLVAILAVALLGAFGYVSALIVGTAPNDYDVLWYHLARAAFWKQQHAVAYIPHANDARLNGFPPNAEIAASFSMILGNTERFAGFVQLSSLVAATVAIGGSARTSGLTVRQAAFGALLFATLPVVILQSATSLNDLVFSACLAVCAYFLFTWSRVSLWLLVLALGLAIGTKITALLGLPVLALLGAFLYPRRRWPVLVGVGALGTLLGSPWYLLNYATTHSLDGKLANPKNATTITHGDTYSIAGVV